MTTIDLAVTATQRTRPEGAHATGYSDPTDLWLQIAHAFEGPSAARKARYAPLAQVIREDDFVVDLGCGDGTFLDLVRERRGRGIGVDLDPVQVAECAARGHEAICARIQDIDWSDRRPDMVSLIHIIEHVSPSEALDLLRAAREALSQRGRLLIVTPNIGHPVVQENFWLDVTHVRPYPRMLLDTFVATLGFPYFQSGTMANGLETWSYAYSDPGDELRFDSGVDFELIIIRLVEQGFADDVDVIMGAVATLSQKDADGFELEDLLGALRRGGKRTSATRLADAAREVAERNAVKPFAPPQSAARDADGLWRHPHHGYRFEYRPEDRFVGPGLATGSYEPYESELFCSMLRPDSVVLDVGANIGHFSLMAAARIDPTRGRIVALEPSGDNYATLIANLAANQANSVKALRLAASSEAGALTLHLNRNNTGDHRLVPDSAALSGEFQGSEEVPVQDIDSLCEELGIVPSIVKIDTQGHELEVFRGMAGLLDGPHPLQVLFEFAPELMRIAGASWQELLDLSFESFDELYIVDEAELRLLPASREVVVERCRGENYTNLLGVKRGGSSAARRRVGG